MHPAPSIIAFTVLSGAGFGLLALLGLGLPAATGWPAFAFHALGAALAVGGLAASAFHLGNPQRALRAFTQWRTSWLSREAVLAAAALTLAGLHGGAATFLGVRPVVLGGAMAALCLATVFATSMIYAQLRSVPRWHRPATPALFVAWSVAGGALLAAEGRVALVALVVAGAVQLHAWRTGERRFAAAGQSVGSATGLGGPGRVRQLAPPHTGRNYLLDEMVFRVGRRHARRLRALAFGLAVLAPAAIVLGSGFAHLSYAAAAPLHLAGMLAARWLFFAEAEHVVGLYYDARRPA